MSRKENETQICSTVDEDSYAMIKEIAKRKNQSLSDYIRASVKKSVFEDNVYQIGDLQSAYDDYQQCSEMQRNIIIRLADSVRLAKENAREQVQGELKLMENMANENTDLKQQNKELQASVKAMEKERDSLKVRVQDLERAVAGYSEKTYDEENLRIENLKLHEEILNMQRENEAKIEKIREELFEKVLRIVGVSRGNIGDNN